MCIDPVTMAFAGLSAVGSIMQGNAQRDAYQAQAAQYAAQSELQHRQSVIEQVTSQYQQRRKGEQLEGLAGAQRNAFAQAGVTIEGSPTDVIAGSRQEGALDIEAIRWNSTLKAGNLDFEGSIASMNAANARKASSTAETAGYINAATSLLKPFAPQKTTDNATLFGLKF